MMTSSPAMGATGDKGHRRRRNSRGSQPVNNKMMSQMRNSFQTAERGKVIGDQSPLEEAGHDGQRQSTTPGNVAEFSEGLDSASAPHVKMAKAQVSSFMHTSKLEEQTEDRIAEASGEDIIAEQDHFNFANQDDNELNQIRSSEVYPRKPMPPMLSAEKSTHAVQRSEIQVYLDDSSEEGIPIPEELSVSQIPIQHQSEIMKANAKTVQGATSPMTTAASSS